MADINLDKALDLIEICFEILEKFSNDHKKILNLNKLMNTFSLTEAELDKLLEIIFKSQNFFNTVIEGYEIRRKKNNNQSYIYLNKKNDSEQNTRNINLTMEEVKIFGDFFYFFFMVKKGKGINIKDTELPFIKDLVRLYKNHPKLFFENGGTIIYPSDLGMKLGDTLMKYNTLNKEISNLKIGNYTFVVN